VKRRKADHGRGNKGLYKKGGLFLIVSELTSDGKGGVRMLRRGDCGGREEEEGKTDLLIRCSPAQRVRYF